MTKKKKKDSLLFLLWKLKNEEWKGQAERSQVPAAQEVHQQNWFYIHYFFIKQTKANEANV